MDSSDDASQSDSEADNETTDFSVQVELATQQLHQHDIELGEDLQEHMSMSHNTHNNENSIKLLSKSRNSLTQ